MRFVYSIATALLVSLAPVAGSAQSSSAVAIPDSPSGRVFRAYLDAVNTGSAEKVLAFVKLAAEDPNDQEEIGQRTARVRQIRETSGGLQVTKFVRDGGELVAEVTASKGGAYLLTMEFGKRPNGALFVNGVSLEELKK